MTPRKNVLPATATIPKRRCAVYTRKSTDEGLDQEYNSLEAQRDAGLAYIASQRHEGWVAVNDTYDDGGFSGGSMDRPALKRLMTDIEAGRIDIVVVYKIDRLTRSLPDFARLIEVFDRTGVSFVSVTQQFNTTTSMGRLTLNILLSFAQFEREVTGERIRDKIAASKAKGMWMGGVPPLGYDVVNRKLIVNEPEATLVRDIFRRYAEHGSSAQLVAAGNIIDGVKSSISGKTGPEVIAYANDIRREREERAKLQAFAEIKELQAKKLAADKAKTELANFMVLRSGFYKQQQPYGGDKPIIELSVRNDTSHPVSRAYFQGTLASPNRAVPWLKETFNYQISGGLEPGEEATWSLAPNQFGDWGRVNAPADAVLTVTVTRLDGADEKALFSSNDFRERDAERLDLLLKQYGEPPQGATTSQSDSTKR